MTTLLSERRKADRRTMVEQVAALARRFGLETEIVLSDNPEAFLGPRADMVTVRHETGLAATIDFNGDSTQPDVYVVSWHGLNDPHKLASHFADSINSIHRHKATTIAEGFDALTAKLARDFQMIQTGEALQ